MRRLVALLTFLSASALVGPPAHATDADNGLRTRGGVNQSGNSDPTVFAISDGKQPPPRQSGSAAITCLLHDFAPLGFINFEAGSPTAHPIEGNSYYVVCHHPDGRTTIHQIVYRRGVTVVDGPTLAREAFRRLPLDYPVPATAPPYSGPQLVGVRTWLWIDPADYRAITATADVPGLTVTATATPIDVRWTMGDGTPTFSCNGPAIAYRPDQPDASQHTDCSHVYQRSGSYTATAVIDWTVTWQASDGTSGTLPTVTRATTFPIDARQRQAVITQ